MRCYLHKRDSLSEDLFSAKAKNVSFCRQRARLSRTVANSGHTLKVAEFGGRHDGRVLLLGIGGGDGILKRRPHDGVQTLHAKNQRQKGLGSFFAEAAAPSSKKDFKLYARASWRSSLIVR